MTYSDLAEYIPSSALGLAGLGAGLFITWYITTAVLAWYRLRNVPGPFLASFSYLWTIKNILLGRQAQEHEALKKYGSIVRTSPNYLVTDDPAVLRRVNSLRSNYPRDPWYAAMRTDEHGHMGCIIDTPAHDKRKAKLLHGYNGRENINVEGIIDAQLSRLVCVLRDRHLSTGKEPKSVDLSTVIRYFTLDVITSLSYGEPFGFLDADGDLFNYTKSMDRFVMAMSLGTDIPMLRWILSSPLLNGVLPKPTDKNGLGKAIGVAQSIVDKRYEKGQFENGDMVGAFMRHGATRQEVVSESILTLIAGSDTSATAIRSTLLYIIATPTVYHRLKAEVQEAVKSGSVSSPITVEQAKALPYLQAVIQEGFRMRPPAIYGHYKVVPPEGDTLNGLFIPGGTGIGHNSIAMMRSEKIFGADADFFRPERFLECSKEERDEMERTIDLVFGMGRWMCAGKTVAQTELHKVYFELLRVFDFQLVYPARATEEASYFVFTQSNMWARVTASA